MHRGLVDSAALNDPVQGVVGTTRPSTIRFALPDYRDGNSSNTGGAVLDPFPIVRPERLYIKRIDDKTFKSEIS